MADVNVLMADAGALAGAASGVKSRAEPGAGKGQTNLGDERGEEFEQLVAKSERGRASKSEAETEKVVAGAGHRPRMPVGSNWSWPEKAPVGAQYDEQKNDEADSSEMENADERAVPKEGLSAEATATRAAGEAMAALQAASRTDKPERGDAGVNRMGGDIVDAPRSYGPHNQPRVDGLTPRADASDSQMRAAAARGEPARTMEASSADTPESPGDTGASKQPPPAAANKSGVPMQPGAVEPAAVQLAAVLAQGRETGKRAEPVRTPTEAPAKIHVSLTETHFSPVKPNSELEAHDLAQRMDGRADKDIGRSMRDALRLQAGLRQDLRSEKGAASGQAQGDVRAEMLSHNIARPLSGGDIAGQIGTKVLQELEQSRPVSSDVVQVKQSDPVLKVLEIKLEPRELGSVVVRMSLRNDVLNIELGFGKSDAAAAIAKSTDQLSHHLRSSGYDVDSIVVRIVDGDRASAPVVHTVSNGDAAQGQVTPNSASSSSPGMTGQSFGEQGERRPADRNGQPPHQNSAEGSHAPDNSQSRSSSDLFV